MTAVMRVAGLGRQGLQGEQAPQKHGREQALAEFRHGLSGTISRTLSKALDPVSRQL